MILLWGIASDGPLSQVHAALLRAGAPVAFLDQQRVLQGKINLTLDDAVCGTLRSPDCTLDLAAVTAVYVRPYDTLRMRALLGAGSRSRRLQRAFAFEGALTSWIELTPALVVNRPSAMASNNAKPYQLQLIRASGFDVPDTLVTTDAQAIAEFWDHHKEVIYKSISGVRSIVTKLGADDRDRLRDVCACPTQFQQYIDGTDVRVHVVGDEVFGCEIHSAAHDYRYPHRQSTDVRLQRCDIPADVAARCRQLAASLGLLVTGIDLRRTPNGNWYCFEANPSPGFTYFEEATGHPISDAIASVLARATISESAGGR
jgi:glutathione synthase/RimK-type ligase-like ATP-grasp enzyme